MTEEEAKVAKHQEYVEKEKIRRSRIKEFFKTAGTCVIVAGTAIGAYVLGKKSWSLTVSWLLAAVSDVKSVLQVGDHVQLQIGGGSGMVGYAYIKTVKVTATKGSLASGSFQFVGDGELAQAT